MTGYWYLAESDAKAGFMQPIGTAGEHMVCADLILVGFWAALSSPGLPYDVVTDVCGRLLKVQVKSTLRARPRSGRADSRDCYQFDLKGGVRRCDLVACVALDIKQIAYLTADLAPSILHLDGPAPRVYLNTKGPKRGCKTFSDFPLHAALGSIPE